MATASSITSHCENGQSSERTIETSCTVNSLTLLTALRALLLGSTNRENLSTILQGLSERNPKIAAHILDNMSAAGMHCARNASFNSIFETHKRYLIGRALKRAADATPDRSDQELLLAVSKVCNGGNDTLVARVLSRLAVEADQEIAARILKAGGSRHQWAHNGTFAERGAYLALQLADLDRARILKLLNEAVKGTA